MDGYQWIDTPGLAANRGCLCFIPLLIFYGTAQITQEQANSEAKRAEAERELAEQRAQDEALQAYLDQMNNLLLEHNLRDSEPGIEVPTLARARTLTVLSTLDPPQAARQRSCSSYRKQI